MWLISNIKVGAKAPIFLWLKIKGYKNTFILHKMVQKKVGLSLFLKKNVHLHVLRQFTKNMIQANIYFKGAIAIVLMGLISCVSQETYNDIKHKNIQLEEQALRANGLNQQLQAYIDRHIQEFHQGEHIVVPQFAGQTMPAFVLDSQIRDLRIEINRLKREGEWKDRALRELREKCGDAMSVDTDVKVSVELIPKDSVNKPKK